VYRQTIPPANGALYRNLFLSNCNLGTRRQPERDLGRVALSPWFTLPKACSPVKTNFSPPRAIQYFPFGALPFGCVSSQSPLSQKPLFCTRHERYSWSGWSFFPFSVQQILVNNPPIGFFYFPNKGVFSMGICGGAPIVPSSSV